MHSLEFEPLARSLSRVVQSCRALRDYAFFMGTLGLGELLLAELGDMLAVVEQWVVRQQSFQKFLAFKQRFFPDILAAHEQRIENDIEQVGFLVQGVLQELKARAPLCIERTDFAVYNARAVDLKCRQQHRVL